MRGLQTLSWTLLTLLMWSTNLWAQPQPGEYYGHHMMWGNGMFFGSIMMFVFIAVIVGVVVFLVRWLGGHGANSNSSGEHSALDILKERFARGEIDKDEYEERMKILRK